MQEILQVMYYMGQALYRKYRPKTLTEIVGQKHITDTLKNAIANQKISHAYLLTGPRGVGKTSVARILAHEINNLDYDESQHHMDIIEIDAASNRRIDEIRDLRDKVHILPSSAPYKVYIIDEVHMLTREAFNALLKTLEEPPKHAIFILATTEAHKLPETIISRTQHFSFKPIPVETLVSHLQSITKSEKINIDSDALTLIAHHGDGSFRDSISLLDQARSISSDISIYQVQSLLGVAPDTALHSLLDIIQHGTPKQLFEILAQLREQGLQSTIIAKQLGTIIRTLLISDTSYQTIRTTELLQQLLSASASAQPDRMLEIVLLEYIFKNDQQHGVQSTQNVADQLTQDTKNTTKNTNLPKKAPANLTTKSNSESESKKATTPTIEAVEKASKNTSEPKVKADEKDTPVQPTPTKKAKDTSTNSTAFDEAMWPIIIAKVKKSNSTIYGILRMAHMVYNEHTITLSFNFAFHQKQINESKNRKIIEDIIKQETGKDIAIKCVVDKQVKKNASHDATSATNSLETVSNIFGGGEVLESGI